MALSITSSPTSPHPAFNPALLVVSATTETDVTITINAIQRKREVFSGVATFDLSSVVKKLFVEGLTEINAAENASGNKAYTDGLLSVAYTAGILSGTQSPYIALNAVKQAGESSSFASLSDKLLTGFASLRNFAGYPQYVSVLSASTTVITCKSTTADVASVAGAAPGRVVVAMIAGVAPYRVQTASDYRDINNYDAPENPFFVRWINRMGGWDYWMFAGRQQKSFELSDQQTFRPHVANQETARGYTAQVAAQASGTIKVGTEGLTENEFDNITALIYSPRIEWYNESLSKWLIVTVKKSGIESDTSEPQKAIEVTFELPTHQLQH